MYDSTKEQKPATSTGWDAANTPTDRNDAATGTETGELQETLTQVKDQAKQALVDTVDDVKVQANSKLAEQKQQAADRLGSIASALRTTSQDLHAKDETVAQYVDSFADQIEKVSGYIQNQDISELLRDAQQLARARPELFVAGALATGFLVGRFFKSSSAPAGKRYRGHNYAAGQYNQAPYGQHGPSAQASRSPGETSAVWTKAPSTGYKTAHDDTYSTAVATSTMESEGNYAR